MGRTIADRYRVLRVVAEGGMGIVYEAEQAMGEGSRRVAIKTLLPELSQDHVVVSRFTRECAVVAGLEHPNTVRVYDFGRTEDGILYIAMEFVRGRPLGDVMAEGRLSIERCLRIVEQISLALEEAHQQGIVHRDLKPDNVVLTERAGIHDFVKLLDFGIAMRSSQGGKRDTKLTQQGMVLGTPPYMSPEQFTAEVLDRTSDIYSLGVIVYEMLNGRLPFDADTPWQWAHHHMSTEPTAFSASVPKAFELVVLSALSKQRTDRPPTAIEFYRRMAHAAGVHSFRIAPSPAPTEPPNAGAIGRTEPSALPISAAGSLATEPEGRAFSGAGRTASDVPALGRGTYTPTGTAPGVPPLGSSTPTPGALGLQAGVAQAVTGTGTVPGARALAPLVALLPSPSPTRLKSKRRRGRAIIAWGLGALLLAGTAVAALAYWAYWQEPEPTPPPVPTGTEPAVAVVASEPNYRGESQPLSYSTSSPAVTPKVRSITVNTTSATGSQTPAASGAGGTTAQGGATPSTASTGSPSTTSPASPLPFPFPFSIPTGLALPFPQANPMPTAAPTQVPATNQASGNAIDGLANCAQATRIAGSDMNAAVDQYLICQNTAGSDAARATRNTLAHIGRTRAGALARGGQCAEAQAVVTALARINAQSQAQAALKGTTCAAQ